MKILSTISRAVWAVVGIVIVMGVLWGEEVVGERKGWGEGVTENTGELSSSTVGFSREGENTIECGKLGCLKGFFVLVNPGGYDGESLNPALLGFGNRDDVEERRWSIIGYSPTNNEMTFLTVNKNEEVLKTEYVFRGNVRIEGDVRGVNMKLGGSVGALRVRVSECVEAEELLSKGASIGILSTKMVDLMEDEYKSACKACDFDGRYLYVGMYAEAGVSPFRIYDCVNPDRPVWVSPKEIEGMPYMNVRSVRYHGEMVYVVFSKGGKGSMGIIDVRNRTTPAMKSTIEFSEEGNFLDIDKMNQIVYLCTSRRVYSIDVHDVTTPRVLGKVEVGGMSNCLWTIKYSVGYIYCGGRNNTPNTLHIIDVSDPNNMREVVTEVPIDLNEGMWSLDVDGDYVYIASGGTFTASDHPKFYVVDVREKDKPRVVASMGLGRGAGSYVKKVRNLCYVSTLDVEGDNFYVIDVKEPKEPRIIASGRYGNLMLSFYPAHSGKYIYMLFGDFDRRPPFLGLVKSGELIAGEIKAEGIHITPGNTLKIGNTELTEEQLKALLNLLEQAKGK